MKKPDDIHIGQKPIDDETKKKAKEAGKKAKEGKPLTQEEIDARAARKAEQEEKRARIARKNCKNKFKLNILIYRFKRSRRIKKKIIYILW
jgi:hypothetical protein